MFSLGDSRVEKSEYTKSDSRDIIELSKVYLNSLYSLKRILLRLET